MITAIEITARAPFVGGAVFGEGPADAGGGAGHEGPRAIG